MRKLICSALQDNETRKPKRAAWDTKGKLEDLQDDFERLRRKVEEKENDKQQVVVQKSLEIQQVQSDHQSEVRVLRFESTRNMKVYKRMWLSDKERMVRYCYR